MLSELPYYRAMPELFRAEVATFRDAATAEQLLPEFCRVLASAVQENCWAMFGSAKDDPVLPDVTELLDALYDRIIRVHDSGVNGYHQWGYLWHFSRKFADRIASAPESRSKLFLCPADLGPSFSGVSPMEVGSEGCVTPPLLGQAVRCPLMCMIGRRGAIFTPFGKGGNTELACHREWMQIRNWSVSPFTGWPADKLPRRFLLDTLTETGWHFEAQRELVGSWVRIKSLYQHDLEDHRLQELVIRVSGRRLTDEAKFPIAEEFETVNQAADFVLGMGM